MHDNGISNGAREGRVETFQMLWEYLPEDLPLKEVMVYVRNTYIFKEA